MKLYVNGDSNSASHGRFWINKVCSSLNTTCINHAMGGGSNPRILRTVQEFLETNKDSTKDLFMIIGWTSWEREEWLHDGTYYQVNASGVNSVPLPLQNRYKEWIADPQAISQIDKSRIFHEKIYNLHRQLREMQIRHLFFNALMPFQHEVKFQPELRLDWSNNFLGPYENDFSYYWFLKNRGFVPDQSNHHQQPAQEVWADLLLNFIDANGMLR